MRPRNEIQENPHENAHKAPVISLFGERAEGRCSSRTQSQNAVTRHNLVAQHVNERLEIDTPGAVAVALVILRSDGSVDASATGVEPEFTKFILRGMDSLAGTLRHERDARSSPQQRGSVVIPALSLLGFVVATYLNEHAWLDAALSVLAQLVAARCWNKRHEKHPGTDVDDAVAIRIAVSERR